MKKKVLALVLTLAMLASVLTVPAAAVGGKTFPDAKGHWAEESIMRWSRCGLVNGDDLGNVNPDKPLRRCEMATILSNMLGLRTAAPVSTFRDINGTEWYARAILRCAAAGIMQGSSDSMSLPEDYITREEAITMFCRALNVPRDDDPDLSKFSDGDKVSGWAAPYLTTLTELGILSGMGDGSVAPHDYINRAGAFTLMDKAISVYANAPGNYPSQNANGFVVINANTYQAGDVIVSGKAVGVLVSVSTTDTVRLRDLSAENVDINGKGSVVIAGKSSLDNVEAHTEIEMTVEANATVDLLDINSEKITLTNAGTIKNLSCDKVATVTNSGKVENLVADAAISITNTGTVDKLVANAGITVDNNKGTIKDAQINAGGVVMDGAPQQMTVATGVARPNNSGGRPVSASGAVSTPSSGGSSSRPSSGGSSTTVAVTGVTLSPSSWVMNAGKTKTLTAIVAPSNASNKNVTWKSSNTEVATVSGGVVTAVAEGEATITVTTASGSKTATCQITVRAADDNSAIPVKSVSFDKSELELTEENTATLTLIIDPANATVDGAAKWESSDTDVVAVDQSGKLTALKPGTATITATVTVTTTVPDESGENPGDEQGETGDDTDDNQGENEGNTDETENPGESGGVDTQAETTHTETYTAKCEVTVKAKPVTTVAVERVTISDKPEANPKVGEEFTLKATVLPENATDKAVTWTSSDPEVATVVDGKVTAKKNGTTTITATAGGQSDSFTLTVDPKESGGEEIGVTSVTISNKPASNPKVGDEFTLTATVLPANATDKAVTWTSSDTAVATVADGKVTTKKDGTTTITAAAGGQSDSFTLTVDPDDGDNPDLTPTIAVTPSTLTLTLKEGEDVTQKLTVTTTNADDAEVTWSSSDEQKATVSPDGIVTAVGEGEVDITASITVGGTSYTAKCVVTVNTPEIVIVKVSGVTVSPTELTVKQGETLESSKLTAIITPEDANNKKVTWSTDNADVATVDDEGNVTIVGAAGTATITVTTEDGEFTATCTITVTAPTEEGDEEETDPTEGGDETTTPSESSGTEGEEENGGEESETVE